MSTFVGKQFPDVTVKAIDEMGDAFQINVLQQAIDNKKKVVLFWYPKDFTFVCPTEIHAFQEAAAEFAKRNTIVIGASCDTAEVHFAWLNTAKDNGGIEGVKFPIIADSTRNLAMELGILDYDMFDEDSVGDNVPYRATYLLDETGMVFHESINQARPRIWWPTMCWPKADSNPVTCPSSVSEPPRVRWLHCAPARSMRFPMSIRS